MQIQEEFDRKAQSVYQPGTDVWNIVFGIVIVCGIHWLRKHACLNEYNYTSLVISYLLSVASIGHEWIYD